MRTWFQAALIAATGLLAGCEARQLYIAHDTVIGVNANVNQARSSGRLTIGYDRDFVTVIPKSVDLAQEEEDGVGKEAMSAMACSEAKVNGLFLTHFVEHIATGQAARHFAEKLKASGPDEAAENFFSCFEK